MNTTTPASRPRSTLRLSAAMLTCLISGSAMASSYSTLLGISNNQNWKDPAWAEVTIEDDDSQGAGGIKFTVNLCDDHAVQCSSGPSDDYGSGQNTIEQFGFGFSGTLSAANLVGEPASWELESGATMDGFGSFLYAVSRGAQGDTVEPLVFWILADGDSVADYASIGSTGGQPNAGSLFAVKVASDKAGAFIGGGSSEVPLPGTLGLLGIGIAGLGVIRRRA